jgi:hypothetical protein
MKKSGRGLREAEDLVKLDFGSCSSCYRWMLEKSRELYCFGREAFGVFPSRVLPPLVEILLLLDRPVAHSGIAEFIQSTNRFPFLKHIPIPGLSRIPWYSDSFLFILQLFNHFVFFFLLVGLCLILSFSVLLSQYPIDGSSRRILLSISFI